MASLTVHHWRDVSAGLAEMTRVARRRVVLVAFDPEVAADLWIVRDYLPEADSHHLRRHPSMTQLLDALPGASVQPLLAPRDCTDRMFATLWARPEQYLDPQVRAARRRGINFLGRRQIEHSRRSAATSPPARGTSGTGISARRRSGTSAFV